MKVSDCCGARVIGEVDPICSECKEHCEVVEDSDCSLSMNTPDSMNKKPLNPDDKLDMLILILETVLKLKQRDEVCSCLDLSECCQLYEVKDSCDGCPFSDDASLHDLIMKLRGMR